MLGAGSLGAGNLGAGNLGVGNPVGEEGIPLGVVGSPEEEGIPLGVVGSPEEEGIPVAVEGIPEEEPVGVRTAAGHQPSRPYSFNESLEWYETKSALRVIARRETYLTSTYQWPHPDT